MAKNHRETDDGRMTTAAVLTTMVAIVGVAGALMAMGSGGQRWKTTICRGS